jgi:FMN phosphatase YigB (HAD superfamily)
MNENQTDTFYILDLDRTLFDTIAGAELLTDIAFSYDAALGRELRIHTDELLVAKTSFSVHDFIRDFSGEEAAEKVREAFLQEAASRDLLLDGARELIDFLKDQGARMGILTYGSPEGQSVKIVAAGLDSIPHLITSESKKGRLLSSWYKSGSYELPPEYGGEAEELVLVDDKVISFTDFPEANARGYWIRTDIDAVAAAPVASNVKEVSSLHEVIALEAELTNHKRGVIVEV